ncbi:MAG: hypothetical protein L0K86_29605 [Actinomycetia bacterium]|nr:hypothetical protein [Actinomycetes bacterium]
MDDDPWRTDDNNLLDAVRGALRERHEVPEYVIEMGRAAFTWRTANDELAALVADSSSGAHTMAGTRAGDRATLRELTFALRGTTVYLQVANDAVQGQIVPPRPGHVDVHEADRPPRSHDVDEHGWFSIAPLPVAEFRLRWHTTDGWTASTAELSL